MGSTRSNVAYKEILSVYDFDGETPVTGLSSSAFSFSYLKDGVTYTDTVSSSVTDRGSGRYESTLTFPETGFWTVFIEVTYVGVTLETHQLSINVSDVAGDSIYASSASAGSTVQSTVGGISAGTSVASLSDGTKTVSDILDEILFPPPPRLNPSISQPSVSLSSSITGLQRAGASVNINFTTTASLGTISASWINPTQDYAGPLSSAEYVHDGVTSALNVTGDTGIDDFSVSSYVVQEGNNNSWTLRGTFSAGSNVPVDSYGDNSGSAFSGGTRSSSVSFEGVYPVFIKNSSGTFDEMSLRSHSTSTISMSQPFNETATLRHAIKIPTAMGTSPTFQVWNSISESYSEPASPQFTSSAVTETIEGNSISYTLFEKTGPVGGGDVGSQPLYRITGL